MVGYQHWCLSLHALVQPHDIIRIKTRTPWSEGNSQHKSHKNEKAGQVWWHTYLISALMRQRRGQFLGVEASLFYTERYMVPQKKRLVWEHSLRARHLRVHHSEACGAAFYALAVRLATSYKSVWCVALATKITLNQNKVFFSRNLVSKNQKEGKKKEKKRKTLKFFVLNPQESLKFQCLQLLYPFTALIKIQNDSPKPVLLNAKYIMHLLKVMKVLQVSHFANIFFYI